MNAANRLVVFGCGYSGRAAARLARDRGWSVVTNVRSSDRAAELRAAGFDVLEGTAARVANQAAIDARTNVLIAFPPAPSLPDDAALATEIAARSPASVVYVSSTGVYGDTTGVIDETSAVATGDPRAARLLAAEDVYRAIGATIFRCAAIYGADRGLHQRVLRGEHRIPGDGTNFTSRIHVDDLAALILAAGSADFPRSSSSGGRNSSETYVIGDREPARQIDVVRWICQLYNIPLPDSVPLGSVHETLRANRQIDASRIWTTVHFAPRFPTYREGMRPIEAL